MRLIVLGAPRVSEHGHQHTISGTLQRLLLALLTCKRREWASIDLLTDALWPGVDPARAESRLHLHVHRLRGRLGAEAVEHRPGGYRLTLPDDAVDSWRFTDLVGGALDRHHLPHGDGDPLADLERGLALWSGTPFQGLDHPLLVAERHRLTELWLLGQETRVQHHLDRGEHEVARSVVGPLAREHPLRERLQVLWMTALHRAGEQAAALEVYRVARKHLVDELGLEPGSELRGVHELVLAGTPPSVAGHRDERLLRTALRTAKDPRRAAGIRRELAMVVSALGRQGEALELLAQAEVHFRHHGEHDQHVELLTEMAAVCAVTGDLGRGCRLIEEAESVDGPSAVVRIVHAMLLVNMRRTEEAAALLADPLVAGTPVPPGREVTRMRAQSQVHRRRGQLDEGIAVARAAYELSERMANPLLIGLVLVDLAACLRDAGDPEAHARYSAAVEHARMSGREPLAAMAYTSWAKAWLMEGDAGRATVHAREGLRAAQRCGSWGFAGRANVRLGDAAEMLGEPLRAAWYRREGLACYRRVDHPLPVTERDRLEQLVEGRC